MVDKEKPINDSGQGFEAIKVKKYETGVKPGGKRA
jgi:hypothetical protein